MIIDCIREGADDYIMKPFQLDELITRIHTTLHHRHTAGKDSLQRSQHEAPARLDKEINNSK